MTRAAAGGRAGGRAFSTDRKTKKTRLEEKKPKPWRARTGPPPHFFLPAPAPFFFPPQVLLGEGGTVVLDGQRVVPTKTQAAGFAFGFPDIRGAVADVVKA